jgi:hypothetical protein
MKSPDLAAWPSQQQDAGELARAAIDRGASQHEGELAELVAFLQNRRPLQRVLEVGVFQGGTLWLWRRLVGLAPGHAVVGIDLKPPGCDDCDNRRAHVDCPLRVVQSNIFTTSGREAWAELIVADSQKLATYMLARKHFPNGVDLLHIDGDHSRAGAFRDFDLYSPLVADDGLLVLHDISATSGGLDVPGGRTLPADDYGPALLWEQLRGAPAAFTIAQEGGYGFGVLDGREWRSHLYEG